MAEQGNPSPHIPERYNKDYINRLILYLTDSISEGSHEKAQNALNLYFQVRPSCKVELNLNSINQDDSRFIKYIEKDCAVTTIQPHTGLKTLPNSPDSVGTINPNLVTITRTVPGTLDQINQEVYDKLVKAGNKKDDAKYAATGVKNMAEAMERLRNMKKK